MPQLIDNKKRVLIYLLFLILLSTINNKTISFNPNDIFAIDQINITGLSEDENQVIKEKIAKFKSQNILLINKQKIEKLIIQNNSIENFEVKKIYPKNINIIIKKTKNIAQIKNENQFIIGANGKLIKYKNDQVLLPFFFGKFDSDKFLEFKKIINGSSFYFKNFKSIFLYPSNRWDIKTKDGIEIKLPVKDLLKALTIAHNVMNNEQFNINKIIDLRILDNIIISE